jgi:hypothetical protein
MGPRELPAGDGQTIVVYEPLDTSVEVDPVAIFDWVAGDAAGRAAHGWRLVSLDTMSLRHSALFMGREGSGYESKVAVICLYSRT